MRAALRRRTAVSSLLLALLAVYAAAQTPAPATSPSPSQPASTTDTLAVPAGATLSLTLLDSLDTRSNRAGDHAHFTVQEDLWVASDLAIPRGSSVRATLVRVKRPGRLAGRAEIRLQFDELILADGTTLPLHAELRRAGFYDIRQGSEGRVKGEGGKGRDAAAVAHGSVQGTILGAAVGGKKGAAYGSVIGASIGLINVIMERGPELELPAGMRMDVELVRELALPRAAVQRARAMPPPNPISSQAEDSEEDSNSSSEAGAGKGETPEAESAGSAEAEAAPDRTQPNMPAPPPPDPAGDPTLGDPNAYRLRVNVQLVLVEAVVRPADRLANGSVEKLAREDFRLLEDGAEQQVRHFSRDELPLAVALVVDTSGSVAPYIRELRRAALEALSQLKREDQVALFVFTDRVDRLVDLTRDRRRVANRIERLQGEGGTNILDALWEASNYLQLAAPDRRRVIILVSDNQATVRARVTQTQLIRNALEADTVIYSIQTPGEPIPLTLRLPTWLGGFGSVEKIARETGGEVMEVDRVGSVASALGAVIERLKTRYTLGYHPSNKARDGGFRRIEVRLADRFGRPQQDYFVFAKRGYYAPRDSQPTDNRAAQGTSPGP